MWVFLKVGTTKWHIGRVLKFAYYMKKKKGSRMYRGNARTVTDKNIGVLCTLYSNKDPSTATFSIIEDKKLRAYQPILYMFILNINRVNERGATPPGWVIVGGASFSLARGVRSFSPLPFDYLLP